MKDNNGPYRDKNNVEALKIALEASNCQVEHLKKRVDELEKRLEAVKNNGEVALVVEKDDLESFLSPETLEEKVRNQTIISRHEDRELKARIKRDSSEFRRIIKEMKKKIKKLKIPKALRKDQDLILYVFSPKTEEEKEEIFFLDSKGAYWSNLDYSIRNRLIGLPPKEVMWCSFIKMMIKKGITPKEFRDGVEGNIDKYFSKTS